MSGQHTWPETLDIMGWKIDPQGFGVIFDRAIPPFAQQHIAPAIAGILGRGGLVLEDVDRFACHPGGSKVIAALELRAVARAGFSRSRTRRPGGIWQHVVADRALRAGARHACRPAFADIADRDGARFHFELRFPEESRVTPAALLLGAVTAERIAELFLARRNTAALLAKGAFEFAPEHYPAIVLMHALWLASLWIFGATRIDQSNLACSLSGAPGSARLDSDDAWPSLDHAHHRSSGRSAGDERPLSLCLPSKLSRRRWRDCCPAPLPWPALGCSHLLRSKRDSAIDPDPCGDDRVDRVGPCQTRLSSTLRLPRPSRRRSALR